MPVKAKNKYRVFLRSMRWDDPADVASPKEAAMKTLRWLGYLHNWDALVEASKEDVEAGNYICFVGCNEKEEVVMYFKIEEGSDG